MSQNITLINKLSDANKEIEELKEKLKRAKELLQAEIDRKEAAIIPDESIPQEKTAESGEKVLDDDVSDFFNSDNGIEEQEKFEKSIDDIVLEYPLEYAASTIAKLVIESAKYSNEVTARGESDDKELLNLILGKTEVSKAEILSVAQEDIPIEVLKLRIDKIKHDTVEYYKSIVAQR